MCVLSSLKRKRGEDDKVWCDGDLTEADFDLAISGLNDNKSLGADGLPAEFYKTFKDKLKPLLAQVFQQMQTINGKPDSFSTGVINIFYKKKGNKQKLDNYRPISLLNTDFWQKYWQTKLNMSSRI